MKVIHFRNCRNSKTLYTLNLWLSWSWWCEYGILEEWSPTYDAPGLISKLRLVCTWLRQWILWLTSACTTYRIWAVCGGAEVHSQDTIYIHLLWNSTHVSKVSTYCCVQQRTIDSNLVDYKVANHMIGITNTTRCKWMERVRMSRWVFSLKDANSAKALFHSLWMVLINLPFLVNLVRHSGNTML